MDALASTSILVGLLEKGWNWAQKFKQKPEPEPDIEAVVQALYEQAEDLVTPEDWNGAARIDVPIRIQDKQRNAARLLVRRGRAHFVDIPERSLLMVTVDRLPLSARMLLDAYTKR